MGIFDFFRRKPENDESGQDTQSQVVADAPGDDIVQAARGAIVTGFWDRAEVRERVADELEIDLADPALARAVDRAWEERLSEEARWPAGSSDYERVVRAFAALERDGFVARMNFTCCNTCGTSEIDAERTPLPDAGPGYGYREERYVFFHEQDVERLAETPANLLLTYSAWRASRSTDPELLAAARRGDKDAEKRIREETDRQVGESVAAALRAEGLTVSWSGDPAQRIAVRIENWRKPLPR